MVENELIKEIVGVFLRLFSGLSMNHAMNIINEMRLLSYSELFLKKPWKN